METKKSIVEHFERIKDPRIERSKEHGLIDILVMSLCAIIGGADSWVEVERFGKAKKGWFESFLELKNGIPSHDTFGRVFSLINPEEFKRSFVSWIEGIRKRTKGEVVSIDGKTLKGSQDNKNGRSAIHMVSAWANKNRVVLGQTKVDEKSNEITAVPELLNLLMVEGCIVTLDAMGCQKEIAEKIRERKGDYVLTVKGNQNSLHDDIELYFNDAEREGFKGINHRYHTVLEKGHGRVERREYWSVSDIGWFGERALWKDMTSIGMVKATRTTGTTVTVEKRYYISSLPSDAKQLGYAVRNHWGIENSLHWVLDVAFREDDCRVRKNHAPENLAMMRHIALNLLKQDATFKIGIKAKRHTAGWDTDYLAKVIGL